MSNESKQGATGARIPGTWARLSDGSWGIHAEPGLSGQTLTVRRKDGSTSQVVLGQPDGGPGLYHVESQMRPKARVDAGGRRWCACGRTIDGDYETCYPCSPVGRKAKAEASEASQGFRKCRECGARPNRRGYPRIYRDGRCSHCWQEEREEGM